MEKNSLLDFSQVFSTDVRSVFAFNPDGNTRSSIARQAGFSTDSLAIPEQVHSASVKWIDAPGEYSGLDGLITQNHLITLTLKVADCVPVYFFDPRKNMIGLVHSGWRGIVGGIISNAIELMQKQGAHIQTILVYLGPSIGICCYEVDAEVANSFHSDAKMKTENRKWKVDLHEQISMQLVVAGITAANIKVSETCTFESEHCHSYRRDGEKSDRMFAFMRVI